METTERTIQRWTISGILALLPSAALLAVELQYWRADAGARAQLLADLQSEQAASLALRILPPLAGLLFPLVAVYFGYRLFRHGGRKAVGGTICVLALVGLVLSLVARPV